MKRRIIVFSAIPFVSAMILFTILVVSSASAEGGYPEGYAEDRAQIQDLINRYMFAMNFYNAEGFTALFAEDGGVIKPPGGEARGRAGTLKHHIERKRTALTAAFDAEGKDRVWPQAGRHFLSNLVLRVDGDKAYGKSYYGHFSNAADDRQPGGVATGVYTDEYVKVNGRWFFSFRTWDGYSKWINDPEIRTKLTEGVSINPSPSPY